MSLDMTSAAAALKVYYTNDCIENAVYQDNPFLAMLKKDESFTGKNHPIPIVYGNPQNRSVTFATAVAGTTTSKIKDFTLTRVKDYSVASIDNELILASAGKASAFMEAATFEIDNAIDAASRSLATALYGTGSGKIGQVLAGSTSTSFTLKEPEDVTNFEVGQTLVFSTANGGGSVKTGSVAVTGVDRDSGVITCAALTAIDSTAGAATNDYVFCAGDYDGKVKGLLAWLPSTAPTSGDSFFGMDRSADVTRLAGIRFDASTMSLEEGLIAAAARGAREGAKPDVCFMSYAKWADLEKSLGSKCQYINSQVNADIGFRGIAINGPRGVIKVIADQNCPNDRAFMLTMNTWKLYSLKKAPHILDTDGNIMLREASSDSVQIRVGYYAQLGCNFPGANVNIKLS